MPDLDRAFAGLIQDLDQRGLLDSTLVLVTSEFGRTPKVNAGGGRDHWPRFFSIVMAGGGVNADADSQYALHLGSFPRPYRVFPLGSQCGTVIEIEFIASDSDQNDSIRMPVSFHPGWQGNHFNEMKEEELVCPSPIPFRISPYRHVCGDRDL